MPRARLAALAAAGVFAVVVPPSALGAAFVPTTRPQVDVVSAALPRSGPQAGRLALDVRVLYATPAPGRVHLLPDPSAATHLGRLAVTVSARGRRLAVVRDVNRLILNSPGRKFAFTHRILLDRRASRGAAAAGRVLLGISVRAEVRADGRGRPDAAPSSRRVLTVAVRRVAQLTAPAAPWCERVTHRAPYAERSRMAVVCMGEGVRVALARRPSRGRAWLLADSAGRALVEYRAPARYVGPDRLALRATNPGGATVVPIPVAVQPFKLRAIGDSVTAGFGYLEDGSEMGDFQLLQCIPPDTPNDRCSSNSPNGPGSGGPVGWSADFGLANGVAWPAQFAKAFGITGPSQYANWAVSGSTPSDWDAGGYLNGTLEEIAADAPDLVVLTLGANPLLDTFLFGGGVSCAVSLTDDRLRACVQSYIDQAGLVRHLQSVLGLVLAAPNTRVVLSQYHLAIPSAALFSAHQLEVMFGVVNLNVRRAARGVTGFGTRLFLMAPPLFNVGRPPGNVVCPGLSSTVDGPSRQSRISQDALEANPFYPFCATTEYWIISPDSGIHPSVAGHAQFAQALGQLATANNLVPPQARASGAAGSAP